jgi:hypothetical protein
MVHGSGSGRFREGRGVRSDSDPRFMTRLTRLTRLVHDPRFMTRLVHDPRFMTRLVHDPRFMTRLVHDPAGSWFTGQGQVGSGRVGGQVEKIL